MLPLVSLPSEYGTQPSAVAAPEPELEPPAQRFLSQAEAQGPMRLALATL